jgi:hypothetical protein
MMSKKEYKPNLQCAVCAGKGWYYAGHSKSQWPALCFRCVPAHKDVQGKDQRASPT